MLKSGWSLSLDHLCQIYHHALRVETASLEPCENILSVSDYYCRTRVFCISLLPNMLQSILLLLQNQQQIKWKV